MVYFKVIVQILIGVLGIATFAMEHLWNDKRKQHFKTSRNISLILLFATMIGGTIITVTDEKDKNNEIQLLQRKLDSVQLTLVAISNNGDTLKAQIKPFLELATRRYPSLSAEAALDSLKQDISYLEQKTSILESSETRRSKRESVYAMLKKTPPWINGELTIDSNKDIYLGIHFLNRVPIKFSYTLVHSTNGKILANINSDVMELFAPPNHKVTLIKNEFNFPDHIPKQEFSKLKLIINYESIYFLQSQEAKLKRQLVRYYKIDPFKNILIEEVI